MIGVSWEAEKYAGNAAADVIGDKWIREAAAATHEQVLSESLKRMEQARPGFFNAVRHRGRAAIFVYGCRMSTIERCCLALLVRSR